MKAGGRRESKLRVLMLAGWLAGGGADMKDGLLSIDLVREIPEAMKARKIDIGGRSEKKEQQAIGEKPASKQTVNAEAEREHA